MNKVVLVFLILLTACSRTYTPSPTPTPLPEPARMPILTHSVTIDPMEREKETSKTLALLGEIQALTTQRQMDLGSQPGWLYLRMRIAGTKNILFVDWSHQLERYEQEKWLYLDPSGKVLTAVLKILDENQQVLQVSLLKDGRWGNLTLGAESPAEDVATFDVNHGFYTLSAGLVGQGRQMHRDTIYHDCWYQGERYTISDGENYYEAVFNPDRMSLRWLKTWQISEGALVLVDSMEMMIEQRILEPPSDILALLSEDQAP
jgi:hypothetical protein